MTPHELIDLHHDLMQLLVDAISQAEKRGYERGHRDGAAEMDYDWKMRLKRAGLEHLIRKLIFVGLLYQDLEPDHSIDLDIEIKRRAHEEAR